MAPGEQHAQDWFLQQRAHCQGTASTGVILSLGPAQAWLRKPRSRGEQSAGGTQKDLSSACPGLAMKDCPIGRPLLCALLQSGPCPRGHWAPGALWGENTTMASLQLEFRLQPETTDFFP